MAKTIPITASRAGVGSVIVVDSTGITKTQALSASRAGAGGSLFSADDGSGKAYSQSGIGVAGSSNDLSLNKSWFIPGIGIESAGSGAVATALPALLPVLVIDDDTVLVPAVAIPTLSLLPAVVVDDDSFLVSAIANVLQFLQVPLVADDGVIFQLMSSLQINATFTIEPDSVFPAESVDRQKAPKEQRLRPDRVAHDDNPFPLTAELKDRALLPALVASDDVTLPEITTLFMQAALKVDGDGIIRPDVGWKLFGQLLVDVDLVLNPQAFPWNYFLPELFKDEEHVDTYPFFIQSLSGGVPVAPREGVLTGSIKQSAKLTGSLTQSRSVSSPQPARQPPPRRAFTGSLKRTTRLSGSMRAGARRSGR